MPLDPGTPGSEAGWGGAAGRPAACPACLVDGSSLHLCFSATRYAEPLPGLILAFKNPEGPFGPRPDLRRVVDHLADRAAEGLTRELGVLPDLVVPIPLHRARLRQRGHNHADWIARRVARRLGRPWDPGLIERLRDTGSQAGRTASDRRENLRGAFRARGRVPVGARRILVVDDVLTTGSTLEAAANALLAAGAAEVWALTLAATVARRRARHQREPYAHAPHLP